MHINLSLRGLNLVVSQADLEPLFDTAAPQVGPKLHAAAACLNAGDCVLIETGIPR